MVSERSALTFIILNSHSNLTSWAGQCSIFDERLVEFLPEPDEQSGLKQQLTAGVEEPDKDCSLRNYHLKVQEKSRPSSFHLTFQIL